jgi:aspartate/methionine/tyrosine aminotransferase
LEHDRQCLIVDEIYQGLEYGTEPMTALTLGQSGLFVINSFSKFFGMTGFRVGWVVAPLEYVEPLERLAQNLFLAPPTLAQHAALAVFQGAAMEELERRRQVFAERRGLLFDGLQSLGFTLPHQPPQGAFYIYAGINDLAESGEQLAADLLSQHYVAITPGIDFGVQATHEHVRFAYTTAASRIEEGLRRMQTYLAAGG